MPSRLPRSGHVTVHLSLASVLVAFSVMAMLQRGGFTGGPPLAPASTHSPLASPAGATTHCELLDVLAEGPVVSRAAALSDDGCSGSCEFLDSLAEGPVVSRTVAPCNPNPPQ